jgi:ABC-type Zn2+ transport system substrate-binding protein/surface adhesin
VMPLIFRCQSAQAITTTHTQPHTHTHTHTHSHTHTETHTHSHTHTHTHTHTVRRLTRFFWPIVCKLVDLKLEPDCFV